MAVSVFPAKESVSLRSTLTTTQAVDLGQVRQIYFILAGGGGGGGSTTASGTACAGGGAGAGAFAGTMPVRNFHLTIGAGGAGGTGGSGGSTGGSSFMAKLGGAGNASFVGSGQNVQANLYTAAGGGGGNHSSSTGGSSGTGCSTVTPTISGVSTYVSVLGDSGSTCNGVTQPNFFPTGNMTNAMIGDGWIGNSGGYLIADSSAGYAISTVASAEQFYSLWRNSRSIQNPFSSSYTQPLVPFSSGTLQFAGTAVGGDGRTSDSNGVTARAGLFTGGGSGGGWRSASRYGGHGNSNILYSGGVYGGIGTSTGGGGGAGGVGILGQGSAGGAGGTNVMGTGGAGGPGGGGGGGGGANNSSGNATGGAGGKGGDGALLIFW